MFKYDTDTVAKKNWREALRLCLAACSDDDVDTALLAILRPLLGETSTARARAAVQSAFCLADEPNVNEAVADEVLLGLVEQIEINDGSGIGETILDSAVMELSASRWAEPLREYLLNEFFRRDEGQRSHPGSLYALAQRINLPSQEDEFISWLAERTVQLLQDDQREIAKAVFL